MEKWIVRGVEISVCLGYDDDSDLELVVKAGEIKLGLDPSAVLGESGAVGGLGINFQEASSSPNVETWPSVSVQDLDRRSVVFVATKGFLEAAEKIEAQSVGFFTMGLELSRVPTWEIAEEIVRAIDDHIGESTSISRIVLAGSTPTQVSSFQFALNNIDIIRKPSDTS